MVDGDTFWWRGEKIRLSAIDAPEMEGACPLERAQAQRATWRLQKLLGSGPILIERKGRDRYGRTLARVTVGGADIGSLLVSEGLARPWPPKARWCGW